MSSSVQTLLDIRRFAVLAALLAGLAVLLALAGAVPTTRLVGAAGAPAMLAGIAASLLATLAGSLPLALPLGESMVVANAVMLAAALRLGLVALFGVLLALSGRFATTPLLLWTALGYVVLLAAETLFTARLAARGPRPGAAPTGG